MKLKLMSAVALLAALGGCTTQHSTFTPKEKIRVHPEAEVFVIADCSAATKDASQNYALAEFDVSYNESLCKLLTSRLSVRLTEGPYGERIRHAEMARISVGRRTANLLNLYLESVSLKVLPTETADDSEAVEFGPLLRVAIEESSSVEEAMQRLNEAALDVGGVSFKDEVSDEDYARFQSSVSGFLFAKTGGIDLIDENQGFDEDAVFVETREIISSANAKYGSWRNRQNAILDAEVEAVTELNLLPNQYLLYYFVGGQQIVGEEPLEDRLLRDSIDVAVIAGTCMLGICGAYGKGGDIPSTIEITPVLLDYRGRVRWMMETSSTIKEDDSLEVVGSTAVEKSLPLDIFEQTASTQPQIETTPVVESIDEKADETPEPEKPAEPIIPEQPASAKEPIILKT